MSDFDLKQKFGKRNDHHFSPVEGVNYDEKSLSEMLMRTDSFGIITAIFQEIANKMLW